VRPRRAQDVKFYGNTIGCARIRRRHTEAARMQTDPARGAAPIRAIRTNVPCGICTRSIRMKRPKMGERRMPQRRHRLSRLQAAAHRQDRRGGDGDARRGQEFEEHPELIRDIVAEGDEKAREAARETLGTCAAPWHLRAE